MVVNFAAGPAKLPPAVLEQVSNELMDYQGTGISVMEMSHRSPQFTAIIETAEANLRTILGIPDNFKVLFMQGGASTGFATIALNFTSGPESVVDYIVTGTWSKKAAAEAEKYCKVNKINNPSNIFDGISSPETWTYSSNAEYVYYCDNETVNGVEFDYIPDSKGKPLIVDMSSNFCSRKFDFSKFAVVYGGAQKNLGPAGCTIVIVREDLLGKARPVTPTMLNLKVMADNKSLYNTPPCFTIYVIGLVLKWIEQQGGIEAMEKQNAKKAELLYSYVDSTEGFYEPVVKKGFRSRMNVPLRIKNRDLEAKFVEVAKEKGLIQLKGHRSVGGLRASLYNSITLEEVEQLVDFMKEFITENK